MAKYTGSLTAQNTSVLLCEIVESRDKSQWFSNVIVSGTFGTGTVTLSGSVDGGVTLVPFNQDGTATVASATAAAILNLRAGHIAKNTDSFKLYASVGAATNPSLTITVIDNR